MNSTLKNCLRAGGVVVGLGIVAQGLGWIDLFGSGTDSVEGTLTVAGDCPTEGVLNMAGTQVEIVNSAEFTVGLGETRQGVATTYDDQDACQYSFTIEGVSTDEDFYGIRIASANNVVKFSKEELFSGGAGLVQGF